MLKKNCKAKIFSMNQIKDNKSSFIELLNRQEEFIFSYKGKEYELVYADQYGSPLLSLYMDDGSFSGKFLQSFQSVEDFISNCKLEGQPISQIINQIKLE